MASSQYGSGSQHRRRRRHTAASENHDWEPRRDESRHSLPYRVRQPDIQRPDGRRPRPPSHSSRRSPPSHCPRMSDDDFLVARPMPPTHRPLARSATDITRDITRTRRSYHDDNDDDDESDAKERLRGRMRSKSRGPAPSVARSRVRTRPTSPNSDSSDSTDVLTPTPSSYPRRSAPPSAPSVPSIDSLSHSDSSDSDSSGSTQDHRMQGRTLKQRMTGAPEPEPAPVPAPVPTNHARSSRRTRKPAPMPVPIPIVQDSDSDSGDSSDDLAPRHPRVVVKRSAAAPRSQKQKQRQPRSSASPARNHRHHDRRSEGHLSSPPSKRPTPRYYHSDITYAAGPSYSKSRTTSSSRVTSPSPVSSSRRSSSFQVFQTTPPRRSREKISKTGSCVVCAEDFPASDLAKLKCGHRMCRSCLKRAFKLSIKDAEHMPPKCCTPDCIPLKHVDHLFKNDFKRQWNRKFAAFSNRGRISCPSKKCDEMIPPNQIHHHRNGRSSAQCDCGTRVCCSCYGKWHESRQCPVDEETIQFLKTAKDEGWKSCYKCHAMVELAEGCNHMKCRCGAEFCMICGVKWKNCECPWFNYDHLTDLDDEFEHVEIPVPMVDRDPLGGGAGLARERSGGGRVRVRPRRGSYDEILLSKPSPRRRNGDAGRRRRYTDYDDDEDEDEDDYLGDMGEVVGLGNAAHHFMNQDYRRSQSAIAPSGPPPVAPPPPSATFERGGAGGNYVSGVNKARGVRGSSMERRLADRFSDQRQGPGAAFRSFGHSMPPPPGPQGMGPPSAQLPMVPSPISRRHTMDDDMYDEPRNPLLPGHPMLRRTTTRDYADDFTSPMQTGRRRQRNMDYGQMESPQSSELAGLTGPASGMHRVHEWRTHVPVN